MPKTVLQHENQSDQTEARTLRRMRWFFLIVILVWPLLALATTGLVIYCTRSILGLSLFGTIAPPAYLIIWVAKRLFPMDEKIFKLEKLKILSSVEKQQSKHK